MIKYVLNTILFTLFYILNTIYLPFLSCNLTPFMISLLFAMVTVVFTIFHSVIYGEFGEKLVRVSLTYKIIVIIHIWNEMICKHTIIPVF